MLLTMSIVYSVVVRHHNHTLSKPINLLLQIKALSHKCDVLSFTKHFFESTKPFQLFIFLKTRPLRRNFERTTINM